MSRPTDEAPIVIEAPEGAGERFRPPISPGGAPFWTATERMLLTLQWCNDCERAIHFPREACPTCLGTDLEYRPAAGSGTVYAATVIPAPANPTMADRAPYVVALVDLPEGVRMMGNVIAEDPWAVAVGDPVLIAWEPLPDGRHLPVCVPAG